MSQQIIDAVNAQHFKKDAPQPRVGDTVNVYITIKEGDKQRVQVFNGVVIATKGRGTGKAFVVRRIVANEGVERTFLIHSPFINRVEVVRSGKVRRAKLYYLRDRIGKARKLREKRSGTSTSAGRRSSGAAPGPAAAGTAKRELAGVEH